MRLTFALPLPALVFLILAPSAHAAPGDLLRVTADVSYQIQPDQGPVHVSWQVTVKNNDPRTTNSDSDIISFYDSLSLPVLRGATDLVAFSPSAEPLTVTLDTSGEGPILAADVAFDRPLFYQETYSFTLDYDLPSARGESLLVTPFYVFLPAVASGDEATVTVPTPSDPRWKVTLEPVDCAPNGPTFACSGPDSVHLAALAEVSRPDATTITTVDLALRERNISITLAYFRGDDPWAQRLQSLLTAALPIIEDLYGFPYPGPSAINISERGHQVIRGYEGLTSCDPQAACEIAISPLADDFTVLHELAHLWSDIYSKRWLSEGFAELVAGEAATRLPPSLLQGEPPSRPQSTLDLRLDEWGDVTPLITTTKAESAKEDAGYDRSRRLFLLLQAQVGLEALQQTNAAIARAGQPVDSRRFMDVLEEVSGQNLDHPFANWVFPDSLAATLDARRQARDRLAALTFQAELQGLSLGVPEAIREDVIAWRFGEALAALDRAEANIESYLQIEDDLAALRRDIQAAGLPFPHTIDAALDRWDFEAARLIVAASSQALAAYSTARQKVDAPRNPWVRFGLLGSDPDASLDASAQAFSQGDFQTAIERAVEAADAVDSASRVALNRILIFLGILAATALAATTTLWLIRRRSR